MKALLKTKMQSAEEEIVPSPHPAGLASLKNCAEIEGIAFEELVEAVYAAELPVIMIEGDAARSSAQNDDDFLVHLDDFDAYLERRRVVLSSLLKHARETHDPLLEGLRADSGPARLP